MVTYSSIGPRKRFREMIAAHGGGHGKDFPALSYPELFRVCVECLIGEKKSHGASGVARVSDRGRVAEV